MLAVAALCWPTGPGRRPAAGNTGVARIARSIADVAGGEPPGFVAGRGPSRGLGRARAPAKMGQVPAGLLRPLAIVAGCCIAAATFFLAGPAALIAALMVLGTTWLLVRQLLAERRRRRALVDILAALRILVRELQAGAEPGLAAANGTAVASRDGALVLAELAQLTRTEGRSAVAGSARAGDAIAADSTRGQVVARLRAGWLLTRWYGLAFSPLVLALVQDLSEQQVARTERAGQVAGPRTSGFVMAGLPLLGLALGAGMGADPWRVLIGSAVGNLLLVVGVCLTCAGLLWSARIVRS